jgi:hypothetical protein
MKPPHSQGMALTVGKSPSGGAILKGSRTQHPWRACGLGARRDCELPLLPQLLELLGHVLARSRSNETSILFALYLAHRCIYHNLQQIMRLCCSPCI